MSESLPKILSVREISDFVSEIFPTKITKFPKYLNGYIDKVLYSENKLLFLLFELDVFIPYRKIGNYWKKDDDLFFNGLVQDKDYSLLDYPNLIKDSK